jgi:Methyltransferase FkbM domain
VLAYALGKEDGRAQFYVDGAEATSGSRATVPYQKNKKRAVHSYPVDVRKLSSFITEPVDLLKIDIEGGESDVLEELRVADKLKLVKATQLECHYIPGFVTKRLSEVLALLEGEGFTTFVSSPSLPHEAVGRDALRTCMVFAWRDS